MEEELDEQPIPAPVEPDGSVAAVKRGRKNAYDYLALASANMDNARESFVVEEDPDAAYYSDRIDEIISKITDLVNKQTATESGVTFDLDGLFKG